MTQPRAILFDWDNTLVDSWATLHDAVNHMLAGMGRPAWTLDEVRERLRRSIRDTLPQMFGAEWERARSLYLDRYRAVHLDRLTPVEGAADMLRGLAAHGIHLAVVSNKTGALLRQEVDALGWRPWFGRVVGAGDAVADKPDRAPIDLALAESGIEPGPDVWYVGDTALDLLCARNAGCVPVLMEQAVAGIHHEAGPVSPVPAHRFLTCGALLQAVVS